MDEIKRLSETFVCRRRLAPETYKVLLVAAITTLDAPDLVLLAIRIVKGTPQSQTE